MWMRERWLSSGDESGGQVPQGALWQLEGKEQRPRLRSRCWGTEAPFLLSVTRACYLKLRTVTQPHSNPRGTWVCVRFCSHILKRRTHQNPNPQHLVSLHPCLSFENIF